MYLHKEGFKTILWSLVFYLVGTIILLIYVRNFAPIVAVVLFLVLTILLLIIIAFFRVPLRKLTRGEHFITAPADGKIVVIEKTFDAEYFQEKCWQVSIFMSPFNVHLNRYPVSGEVVYTHYHKGKYMAAYLPKSSTENERHSIVLRTNHGQEILVRQIAGALAKRIVNYAQLGSNVEQNAELGFIKFGSRVDLLLPLNTSFNIHLGQKVKGGVSVIGRLP